MKKLNLKSGGIKEMLSREQMKKVVGGYDGGGTATGQKCGTNTCEYSGQCVDPGHPDAMCVAVACYYPDGKSGVRKICI